MLIEAVDFIADNFFQSFISHMNIMAPKKSSRVKKPSKKLLETLEAPPYSETEESESLLTQREVLSQDSPQQPSNSARGRERGRGRTLPLFHRRSQGSR